jgi:hypothetical protein
VFDHCMVAATAEVITSSPSSVVPIAPAAPADNAIDHDAAQVVAEGHFVRAVLIGMGVGIVVCMGIWMVLATMALSLSGGDLGPMLAVGAACGAFAGIFLGGAMGAAVGVAHLERAEHASLPKP